MVPTPVNPPPEPEFTQWDGPTPPRTRSAAAPRLQLHPCANCARQIIAPTARSIYCSDLCRQVPDWIRYFQRAEADGRSALPDVREALGIKLAHIAGGGYRQRERQLPEALRQEVMARDGELCQQCGAPGTDIDHIRDSSPDPSNLQLLCRTCHNLKTRQSMVPAEPGVLKSVHVPIRLRAMESPHRQPCDQVEWAVGNWTKGAKVVPATLRVAWEEWVRGPGANSIDPARAVAGFPVELDAWAWYLAE